PGCTIVEEARGDQALFTIPPHASVVPPAQLVFAFLWAGIWTFGILIYVLVPNTHGAVFNFLALVAGLAGEYLALMILFSALSARLAVERISLGPDGVEKETRLGPVRRTRRAALARARFFRIDAFPLSRGSGRWSTHLYLLTGSEGVAEAPSSGRIPASAFPLAEGAREEDKYWLASRLNAGLRTLQQGLSRKI
ncbi:MAG: hypothetical protein ACE5FC_02305, partial [Myxococcota bacterium]